MTEACGHDGADLLWGGGPRERAHYTLGPPGPPLVARARGLCYNPPAMASSPPVDEQLARIRLGTAAIVSEDELRNELGSLFEITDLRTCRLDKPKGFKREPLFWSVVLRRL